MKLTKFLAGAAALMMAFTVAGCKISEDEENVLDGNKVSFTNTKDQNYRMFVTAATKHYSSNAAITINNPSKVATDSAANATYGYVFGLSENVHDTPVTDKTTGKEVTFYDFGIAALRWNKAGYAEWYVSWCEDVPNTVFGYTNAGDFNDNLVNDTKYGIETQILPAAGSYFEKLSGITIYDGKVNATIKVTANDDGSYKVVLGDSTATIPNTITGLDKKTQLRVGRYVTIYDGETADGVMELTDFSGAAIVIEE